ncbi:hypothetical protein P153DRAFT_380945 [Dothidotthia symphoricarpi CBS 119687]|uniref:Uncharacterized protein n=1 Tax=Dothidotthia symphoricarpi CBS 119687 TaxID=1392245 RepID=A0A6A6ARB9_9PLEO|nr:uncharacterized protein P153DRAFT_380945 [Dothidotthia symphoricarpi CBS 119687]KAF2133763.1 hypothetical protein P153DRAFT_380945 [Dothidotthia symphoricarpi CBS 119687]
MASNINALANYDIVLAISNEAINAQFEELYRKELPEDLLPPDFEPGDQVALPRPSHYINHDFKVLIKEDGVEDEQELQGIDGHIKCPVVTIHPEKSGVAIVSLTFEHDESVSETDKKDSFLQHLVVEKRQASINRLNINGWTFSWECSIAIKDIDDVMADLVGPAEDQEQQVQLPNETINKLKKRFDTEPQNEVDVSVFTASSIFCMMQAVQMTNSFDIKTPDGYEWPKKLSTAQMQFSIATAKTMVVDHFKNMREAAIKNGKDVSHLPTANNPFVLGYSIRQEIPKLKDLNMNADPTKTPRYFIPRKVDCTTTASPGNKYTAGTLNFCMFTHREDESSDAGSIDIGTVKFPETFFQKLSIRGGLMGSSKGKQGGHDGIMGFSRDIFCKRWLTETVAQPFVADDSKYSDAFKPMLSGLASPTSSPWRKPLQNSSVREVMKGLEYGGVVTGVMLPDFSVGEKDLSIKRSYTGTSRATVRYTSDFLSYTPEQRQESDLRRSLYLDLRVWNEFDLQLSLQKTTFLGFLFGESPIRNLIGVGDSDNKEYTTMIKAFYRSNFKIGYTLSPGQGGIWSMSKDNDRTTFPGKTAPAKVIDCTNDSSEPWKNFSGDGFNLYSQKFDVAKERDMPNELLEIAKDWYGNQNLEIENAVENVLKSIKNAVIMPAGNVLQFKGLDCDEEGNVYSTVDYQTLTPTR